MINVLFFIFSVVAGIIMAELAYLSLLIIDYVIRGSFSFSLPEALHNLKVGGGGGFIIGVGIVLCRLFKIKGF
ncbi:hypothetical protein [Citrobacter sp. Igbk 17]|uniref:hypothetical protein n=1 Tax=Citrobacter sp. Igbk 17 TaxID=2963957 RepID=UPI002303A977|nr:hypothetical protein [Citrobacter sp. Igbk 17]MDA8496601.1 hypothetical protein [Citrobacter sp. Igbk 17]